MAPLVYVAFAPDIFSNVRRDIDNSPFSKEHINLSMSSAAAKINASRSTHFKVKLGFKALPAGSNEAALEEREQKLGRYLVKNKSELELFWRHECGVICFATPDTHLHYENPYRAGEQTLKAVLLNLKSSKAVHPSGRVKEGVSSEWQVVERDDMPELLQKLRRFSGDKRLVPWLVQRAGNSLIFKSDDYAALLEMM